MARRGVWQLRKLTVNYCEWGGSSRGARDFVEKVLPDFVKENPQLAVAQALHRGAHPYLKAEYANKTQRIVGVKNQEPEEILEHAFWLRGNAGRTTTHRVKRRQITAKPSIQGGWTRSLGLRESLTGAVNQTAAS